MSPTNSGDLLYSRQPVVRCRCPHGAEGTERRRLELRQQVRVLPRVDQATLAALYRDADVFIFPSLYEGFSRAIVEAMASRLPIVCTPVGVAADALQHETSALIVPTRQGVH